MSEKDREEFLAKRAKYAERFKLSERQTRKIDAEMLKFLDGCADDMARRLLLGVSEKFTPEEQAALSL